ncbi:MAG TPA: EipA family protein [Methylibium sp.]|nr:EipA family protein [Methylibium sp.]
MLATTRRDWLGQIGAGVLVLATPMLGRAAAPSDADTYDEASTLKAAIDFFGETTEGLAQVIAKAFREQGRPNGFVRGQEVAAAVTAGVRYGEGDLVMKSGATSKVYWSGPSIGFDLGANASKVFVLVYNLPGPSAIFKRYPGVDGSVYYVGGAGINYQRLDGVTLAPVRVGVGLRAGASVGYTHYRTEKSLNPL